MQILNPFTYVRPVRTATRLSHLLGRWVIDLLTSIGDLGRLLHEQWQIKRGLSTQITNSDIDRIYETGIKAGALGGKLLGAGGGWFILFYAPPKALPKMYASGFTFS